VKAPETLLPEVLRRVGLADSYWRLESPVGTVFIAHSPAGISMVTRAKSPAEFEAAFRRLHGRPVFPETHAAPAGIRARVQKPQGRGARDLSFDLRELSEFERAVLLKALEIPPGEVRPYSWIAREIGHPGAVRAAGSALAKNPVPLLIPCHRVVRSDGHIGKYSLGGPRNKRTLLEIEGAQPETLERLAASGVRYLGNAEQKHYCYPTCGGITHLILTNSVRFHDAREAAAAGFHPCEDCRPPLAKAS
jgi:O-6-methylguanine DNA methyltransferase